MKVLMSKTGSKSVNSKKTDLCAFNMDTYWVWLHELQGVTNVRKKELLAQYGNPREIFKLPYHILGDIKAAANATPIQVKNLRIKQLVRAQHMVQDSSSLDVHLLTCQDYRYRRVVRNDRHSPILIYYRGMLEAPLRPVVAIIFPHIPTAEQKLLTKDICRIYRERGYIIALGVSFNTGPQILRQLLQDSGPVYAFCSGGLDCSYPVDHWTIISQLLQQGAMMSVHALGTLPSAYRGTIRNRLLALWADEMVIIGSSVSTSSSTLMKYALERHLPLYQWESYQSYESQHSGVADFMLPTIKRIPTSQTNRVPSPAMGFTFPHDSREAHYCATLYDLLWHTPLSKRELADALNLSESVVTKLLINMESCGSIESQLPGRWRCKIYSS